VDPLRHGDARLSERPGAFDDEGFFNTQDMVETDGEYVRILGRRSEVINVGGEKGLPERGGGVLTEAPNVADATVSGRPSPVTGCGHRPDQADGAGDPAAAARRLRAHCARHLEAFKVPALLEFSTPTSTRSASRRSGAWA